METGERESSCQEQGCDKKFPTKERLEDHLRSTHGAAKIVCKEANCTAVFSYRPNLSKHMKFVHKKERLVLCQEPGCDQSFTTKEKLGDHRRSDHGAAKLTCQKNKCKATFVFSPEYYRHMKRKH